jgi:hypothetical protein
MPHTTALAIMRLRMARIALEGYLKAMDGEDQERVQAALEEAEQTRRLQGMSKSLSVGL